MNSTYQVRFSIMKVFFPVIWMILIFSLFFLITPFAIAEDSIFSIALSKFINEEDAKKEETRLLNSGHNAFYRKEKSPDNKNTEYQVYIEKYNSRDEAEKEAMVLNDLELISDYTVREIKTIPRTVPEENTPREENDTKVLPTPEPAEVKGETPEQNPDTEVQTTTPEPSNVFKEPDIESTQITNEADSETELAQNVNGSKLNTEKLPPADKGEPEPDSNHKTDATDQNALQNPDHKTDTPKKVMEPEQVINHDDARLTGSSLQVGAFKDEANAAELKTQLSNLGKNAFYRYESADSKGEFYRLYITGYGSLRDAIKDAKQLVESGIISSYSRVLSKKPEPVSSSTSDAAEGEDKIYVIHVSSNKDEKNAVENVARLKKYGYNAIYILEKDQSASWYRVYIGRFKDEVEAREKGRELLEQGLISYFKPLVIDKNKLNN